MQDVYVAEGELVGLRPVMPDDAGMLYEVWHDPDTQRNLNFRDDAPLAEWWDDMSSTRSWLDCVIVELAGESPAGMVSLGWIGHDPELIVLLLPEFRGRGLGTEAARLIIDYGFATMVLASVGAGSVTELAYHLDRATWEQSRAAQGPARPCVFDARRALDTIRALDIVRLCGSEDGVPVLSRVGALSVGPGMGHRARAGGLRDAGRHPIRDGFTGRAGCAQVAGQERRAGVPEPGRRDTGHPEAGGDSRDGHPHRLIPRHGRRISRTTAPRT